MTCPPLHIPNKEWSGDRKELENYLAIERWALCKDGCSCYVRHQEATQTIDCGAVYGIDAPSTEIVWTTVNECGTDSDPDAMRLLVLNWVWDIDGKDPYMDPTGVGGAVSARGIYVTDLAGTYLIAGDTRLGLGNEWFTAFQNDCGSLTVPLNIYPAGTDYRVFVGQSGFESHDIRIRSDEFTVCACSCVQ